MNDEPRPPFEPPAPPPPPPPPAPGVGGWGAGAPPVQANAPTQVLGRRTLAIIIDGILMSALYFGLLVALGHTSTSGGSFSVTASGGRALAVFGLTVLGNLLYYALFEGLRGATPGKLICGIRVVTADGGRPGVGRALGRTALRVVDGLAFYLVGWIAAMASGPRRQRLGDLACGTFVVRKEAAREP